MKKFAFTLFLFSIISGKVIGQDGAAQSSIFNSYNKALAKFYVKTAPELQNELSGKPIARFVTDFLMGNGGSVISVDKDSLNNIRLTEHYYTHKFYSFRAKKFFIREKSIQISHEYSNLIEELFLVAIKQISIEKPSSGTDGIVYYFLSQGTSEIPLIASVWSPDNGTNINNIISLCYELVPNTENQKQIDRNSEKIKNLIKEINSQN